MNILGDICMYCYKNCTSQVNGFFQIVFKCLRDTLFRCKGEKSNLSIQFIMTLLSFFLK